MLFFLSAMPTIRKRYYTQRNGSDFNHLHLGPLFWLLTLLLFVSEMIMKPSPSSIVLGNHQSKVQY